MIFKYAKTNVHIRSHLVHSSGCAPVHCASLTIQSPLSSAPLYLQAQSLRHLGLVLFCLNDVCLRLSILFPCSEVICSFCIHLHLDYLIFMFLILSWCFYLLPCLICTIWVAILVSMLQQVGTTIYPFQDQTPIPTVSSPPKSMSV